MHLKDSLSEKYICIIFMTGLILINIQWPSKLISELNYLKYCYNLFLVKGFVLGAARPKERQKTKDKVYGCGKRGHVSGWSIRWG